MKIQSLPSTPPFGIKEEDIQRCAYYLWREGGSPAGCELDFWLAAKELLRDRAEFRRDRWRNNCASMAKKRGAAFPCFR